MDNNNIRKHSSRMKKILAKFNKTTEDELKRIFIKHSIKGWKRHLPIPGRPDFSFRKQKVAVFVDGCFWHGCPRCFRLPKQNRAFWKAKIEGNRRRDRTVNARLRRLGWTVFRIRECKMRDSQKILKKIKEALVQR